MYQQQQTDQICDMIALRKFQSLQIATFVFLQIIANNCFLTAIIDCKLKNLNKFCNHFGNSITTLRVTKKQAKKNRNISVHLHLLK